MADKETMTIKEFIDLVGVKFTAEDAKNALVKFMSEIPYGDMDKYNDDKKFQDLFHAYLEVLKKDAETN